MLLSLPFYSVFCSTFHEIELLFLRTKTRKNHLKITKNNSKKERKYGRWTTYSDGKLSNKFKMSCFISNNLVSNDKTRFSNFYFSQNCHFAFSCYMRVQLYQSWNAVSFVMKYLVLHFKGICYGAHLLLLIYSFLIFPCYLFYA